LEKTEQFFAEAGVGEELNELARRIRRGRRVC
jgi:hypothetical protein